MSDETDQVTTTQSNYPMAGLPKDSITLPVKVHIDGKPITKEMIDRAEAAAARGMTDGKVKGHYSNGGVEPIDLIRDAGYLEGFAVGNIIKYVVRFRKKDGLADLKKARTYLNWLIEYVEQDDE